MGLKWIVKSLVAVSLAAVQVQLMWGQGPFESKQNAELELQDGIRRAKQAHKNILLNFGANWCSPCVSLDQLLETDPELKQSLEKGFVLVRIPVGIDRDASPTHTVRRLYPPFTLVPHLLVLKSDGSLVTEQKVVSLMTNSGSMEWDHKRLAEFLQKCGAPNVCKQGL